uniref:LPD7 domain-containing protein n=1 Tax=Xylella fastidiosa TaxID=2371 RepID=UPI0009BF37C7
KKMALMASFSDNYQDRNEENKEANHLEEDAYRKLAAVDVAQANALVEAEREKIEELLKRSIRLDEAKLLAAMRDLNPELYKAIESRKAEQQRMAAEGAKQLFEAQNMSEHLRNEANKERLEKNSNPILRGAMAMEGAKLLVLAAETELKASFSEDARERDFEKETSLYFEDEAYKKLANVNVMHANALVAAERDHLPDGELKDLIRFDEAKFAAAIRELNPEADKAKAIESRAEQRIAVEKETKKPTVIEAAKQLVEVTKTAMMARFSKKVEAYHNAIEPNIEREQQQLSAEDNAKRSAWVKKAEPAQSVATGKASVPGNNLESDEIFTANQKDVKLVVPPEIEMQYLHVGEKFYHPKNTSLVAFEDKGNKLETKSNSEAIAQSMVRIAEARGWDEIKVSGSEVFRKEVWLYAASRGMHVKGYSPSEQDKAELAKRAASVKTNKVEQDNKPFRARENEANKTTATATPEPKVEAEKPDSHNKKLAKVFALETPVEGVKKHPELAGAFAVAAAIDKKAESDGLTPEQRAIVAAHVRQNVMNSIERGHIPQMKIKEEVEVKLNAKQEKELTR